MDESVLRFALLGILIYLFFQDSDIPRPSSFVQRHNSTTQIPVTKVISTTPSTTKSSVLTTQKTTTTKSPTTTIPPVVNKTKEDFKFLEDINMLGKYRNEGWLKSDGFVHYKGLKQSDNVNLGEDVKPKSGVKVYWRIYATPSDGRVVYLHSLTVEPCRITFKLKSAYTHPSVKNLVYANDGNIITLNDGDTIPLSLNSKAYILVQPPQQAKLTFKF